MHISRDNWIRTWRDETKKWKQNRVQTTRIAVQPWIHARATPWASVFKYLLICPVVRLDCRRLTRLLHRGNIDTFNYRITFVAEGELALLLQIWHVHTHSDIVMFPSNSPPNLLRYRSIEMDESVKMCDVKVKVCLIRARSTYADN